MNNDIYGFSLVSHEMSPTLLLRVKWLFVSGMYRFVSLGCVEDLRLRPQRRKSLCRQNGKRKDFFSHFVFPHWVTQFHGPLAYLRWRAVKSVQFWDFRGTVFLSLLRYVAILLPSPLDRLHHYVTGARVKQYSDMFLALVNWCPNETNEQSQLCQLQGSIYFALFWC